MQRYEKKYLSEYEKILYDTLILFDTKKYEKMREVTTQVSVFLPSANENLPWIIREFIRKLLNHEQKKNLRNNSRAIHGHLR